MTAHDGMTDAKPAPHVTRLGLFLGFLQIGLYGFGGLAAISRHVIVERRKWLNEYDYAAVFGISQALPGGNVINVATILGDRYQGPLGSVAAVTGLFAAPMVLLIIIAAGFDQIADLPDVRAGAAGAAAAAAGLVVGTAFKMMRALRLTTLAKGFSLLAFVSVALLKFPLIATVLVLLPACVAATFMERR